MSTPPTVNFLLSKLALLTIVREPTSSTGRDDTGGSSHFEPPVPEAKVATSALRPRCAAQGQTGQMDRSIHLLRLSPSLQSVGVPNPPGPAKPFFKHFFHAVLPTTDFTQISQKTMWLLGHVGPAVKDSNDGTATFFSWRSSSMPSYNNFFKQKQRVRWSPIVLIPSTFSHKLLLTHELWSHLICHPQSFDTEVLPDFWST
jgi:hypothetical protein